jgi:hypothetical protein
MLLKIIDELCAGASPIFFIRIEIVRQRSIRHNQQKIPNIHCTLQDALFIDHTRVVVSINWFIDIALSIYLHVE